MARHPNLPYNRAAKQLLQDDSTKLAICEWLGKEEFIKDHITDMRIRWDMSGFLKSDTFAKHVREQMGRFMKVYDLNLAIKETFSESKRARNDELILDLLRFTRKCVRSVMTEPVDSSYLAHIGNDIPDAYYDACVHALDVGLQHPERTLSKGSDDWREWRLTSLDSQMEDDKDWVPSVPNPVYTLYQGGEEVPGVRIDHYDDSSHLHNRDVKNFKWVYEERPDGTDGHKNYIARKLVDMDERVGSTADYTNQVKQFIGEADVLVDKFLEYDVPDEHGQALVR